MFTLCCSFVGTNKQKKKRDKEVEGDKERHRFKKENRHFPASRAPRQCGRSVKLLLAFASTVIPGCFSLLEIHYPNFS
jgi:hypothetical protein